jgi:hypothetical protein
MVIWIVFITVDSNVDIDTHHTPHQAVGLRDPNYCGSSAEIGRAQSCFVVPGAAGVPYQVFEFKSSLEPITGLIMPRLLSRVVDPRDGLTRPREHKLRVLSAAAFDHGLCIRPDESRVEPP